MVGPVPLPAPGTELDVDALLCGPVVGEGVVSLGLVVNVVEVVEVVEDVGGDVGEAGGAGEGTVVVVGTIVVVVPL